MALTAGVLLRSQAPEWGAARGLAADPVHVREHGTNLAWVSALLHRAAGDAAGAEECYAKARREPATELTFAEEWRKIASSLIGEMLQTGVGAGDATEVAKAARGITDPTEYLLALGMSEIPHGSRGADLANGNFMDHLLGVQRAMQDLGCGESMCLAGLFHSVYGTGRQSANFFARICFAQLTACRQRATSSTRYLFRSDRRCGSSSVHAASSPSTTTA